MHIIPHQAGFLRESLPLMYALQLVLFDLDDTLFDHQYSRRCGLLALQATYPPLASIPIETLVAEHERHLVASYDQVLKGTLSLHRSARTIPADV